MVQIDVFDPYENLFEKISKVAQIFIFLQIRDQQSLIFNESFEYS